MKAITRLNTISLSITTLCVFSLWISIVNVSDELSSITNSKILLITLSFIFSLGFYKILLNITKYLVQKCKLCKKIIFGASYIDGVWVGFFVNSDKKIRFFYEVYEQDYDSFEIRGVSFTVDGKHHGTWNIEDPVISEKKGMLNYTYETDGINNTYINPGIGRFTFIRNKSNEPPFQMKGYTSDLYNPNKVFSFQEKVEIKEIDESQLFEMAKKVYEKNKSLSN